MHRHRARALIVSAVTLAPGLPASAQELPEPRAHHQLAWHEGEQRVFLFGGSTPRAEGHHFFDDIWSWDGTAWQRAGSLPFPRSSHRVAWYAAHDAMVLFGGGSGRTFATDSLFRAWDGSEWQSVGHSPYGGLGEPGMCHDRKRSRLVLFGGWDAANRFHGGTWEWTGDTLLKIDAPGPAARGGHMFVYDPRRQHCLLFGGLSDEGVLADTWAWDGTAWQQIHASGPSARMIGGAATDPANDRIILFSGWTAEQTLLDDTWAWDGEKWELITRGGPLPRISGQLAFDGTGVVLFGGRTRTAEGFRDLNDTWRLQGGSWIPLYTQAMVFPALPPEAPTGSGTLHACDAPGLTGTARCGVFRVPVDRSTPAPQRGATIDIAFVILDALDSARRLDDAIVLLPGGPGQAFTPSAVRNSQRLGEALRLRRDVLLVDVRGVGRSGGLSCDVPYPRGFASRFGAIFPLDHVAACRDSLSRHTNLHHYTTDATVDDLEELRRWLGYRAFNLNGASYGTRVAQVYLRRHPAAVRTVVMNGVAPVAEPLYVQHAFLLQRSLERLLAECRSDARCHSSYPDLDTQLANVLKRVRSEPVELTIRDTAVRFGIEDLAYALRGLLYTRGGDLPRLIYSAAAGSFQPLADYYAERTDDFSRPSGNAGYHFSVLCAEDIAPLTDSAVASATRGTFLGDYLIRSYRDACRLWPYARLPAANWVPVRSEVPTLLLSGGRDPVTPAEGAAAVAEYLPNSVHVVVPNGGHGVGGECIQRMVAHLVTTGSLKGLDSSCIRSAPPTRFTLR